MVDEPNDIERRLKDDAKGVMAMNPTWPHRASWHVYSSYSGVTEIWPLEKERVIRSDDGSLHVIRTFAPPKAAK